MKIGRGASQLAVVVACALLPAVLAKVEEHGRRVPKQIHAKATVVDSDKDHNAAETGFGGGIGHHGKYFQDFYMLQFGPQQIEFGHVCEDPDEWQQRFERKDMERNRHQGQVRWGDKHGGYGEHYWDYNHAGHDGGDHHHHHDDHHGDGHYSEPVPDYQPAHHAKVTAKRQSPHAGVRDERVKRQHDEPLAAASSARPASAADAPRLVFDVATGTVVDEATGQAFMLTPVQ